MGHRRVFVTQIIYRNLGRVNTLLLFIGMAIGSALPGVYLENRETIDGVQNI